MNTITNVVKYLELLSKTRGDYIFRGQTADWKLVPKLGRNSLEKRGFEEWEHLENDLLDKFMREASFILDKEPDNKIDWLILGQHYGLPTRLLDCTTNPLKALFFACIDRYDEDGVLYMMEVIGCFEDALDFKLKLDNKSLDVFYPKLNNERISLQEGCFIVYPLPKNSDGFEDITKNETSVKYRDVETINKFIIPSMYKKKLLKELSYLGVNHKTMFEGVEGVCKKICYEFDY